jgi:hypothetical protein
MVSLNLKRALFGLAILILMSAPSLRAAGQKALVDDFEGGTNQNNFENYWYYYDDNGGTKADDRPTAAKDSTPTIINVPYGYKPRHAAGVATDTFKLKDYQFLIKQDGSNKYGVLPFTFGTKWKATGYTANPFCGIGTELAPDGKSLSLAGATAVTFKLRSHVNPLQVNFRIETMDIIRDSSFAYYFAAQAVTTTWTTFTVQLPAGLAQPTWAKDAQVKPFDQTACAKLSWECHGEFNPGVKIDTLDIDDISIADFKFVSPSVWTKVATARPTTGLFSTFEVAPKNATPLSNCYWYSYDDHEIAGNSTVSAGATKDVTTGLLTLDLNQTGTGFGNAGTGAAVQLTFGKTVRQANAPGDTVNVQGFIGIGFNTYDSSGAIYFNSQTGKLGANSGGTGKADSIYFEYLADGDYKYLTLEVSDFNDVADKTNPTRKDTRGSGIRWYRNLPMTGPTSWSRVCIPFDSLVAHDTWKGYKAIPLDKTQLAKIQFKAQGVEGKGGTIMIDNVFFPGITFPGVQPISVKNSAISAVQASAFRAFYSNGVVRVDWKPTAGFNNGKISLIDSKGAIVKNDRVASASALSLDVSAEKLPAGLYFVQLNGNDISGKAITQRSAVTILK